MTDPRWRCPDCIKDDFEDPWCDVHSKHLTEFADHDMHSRRVPGVRSDAELDRVARIYGAQAAAQVAHGDALRAALRRPDEQKLVDGLWEADHYDMQGLK